MKIAGITRIADFPFNPIMAIKFSQYVDHLVLGFDTAGGYGAFNGTQYINGATWYELFKRVVPFPSSVTVDMFLANTPAGSRHGIRQGTYFNEELLRRLDTVKPDIVLECEADAHFDYGSGWEKDLANFIRSGADMWMMHTDTVTIDDRPAPEFPMAAHCRGFRWFKGVSYYGGGGCCMIKIPDRKPRKFLGKTRLKHYPIFTKELQQERWAYYGDHKVERIYRDAGMEYPV